MVMGFVETGYIVINESIQLLESPIPTRPSVPHKKRGIIDPLMSKRPEKILNKKIKQAPKAGGCAS